MRERCRIGWAKTKQTHHPLRDRREIFFDFGRGLWLASSVRSISGEGIFSSTGGMTEIGD